MESVDWKVFSVEGVDLSRVSGLLDVLGIFLGNLCPVSVLLEVQIVFDSSLAILNGGNSDAMVVDQAYLFSMRRTIS